jgi:hypothetical protein
MAPGLLADTSSLLRANLDRFGREHAYADDSVVFLSLVLFRDVYLDGPSVERNLDRLSWTLDIDDGVRIVELDDAETRALYRRGIDLAKHVEPGEAGWNRHRPHAQRDLVAEITDRHWAPSTYWRDLARIIPDELREMKAALDTAFGGRKPFTVNTFIALSRLFYYLALQEQLGSALLLDPQKSYTTAERLLSIFDETVTTAFEERRSRWLGGHEPRLKTPMLSRYIANQAEEKGWSFGRTIGWLRESAEVAQFRKGINELVAYREAGDNQAVDEVLVMLDAAAEAWAARLGTPVREKSLKVTVALPFVEPEFTVPVPRLRPKKTGERLLVLMGELLRWS